MEAEYKQYVSSGLLSNIFKRYKYLDLALTKIIMKSQAINFYEKQLRSKSIKPGTLDEVGHLNSHPTVLRKGRKGEGKNMQI